MMRMGGLVPKAYPVEDDKILFVSVGSMETLKVRDFVFQQPECVSFEWNQQKSYPPKPAATPKKNGAGSKKNKKKSSSKTDL